MSNTAIDVVAAFNPIGEIKPVYIRLADENQTLQTYKLKVNGIKEEKYSGINSFLYSCSLFRENLEQEIKIKYYIDSHKWVQINQ